MCRGCLLTLTSEARGAAAVFVAVPTQMSFPAAFSTDSMFAYNQLTRLLIMLCIQLLKTLYAFMCVYVYFTFVYMRIYIYICVCVCVLVAVAVDPSLTSTN